MITPDTFVHKAYRRLSKKDIVTLVGLVIICLFTHYYMFTQRIINEDMLGYTAYYIRHIPLGRWSEVIINFMSPSVRFLIVCILLPVTAFMAVKLMNFSSSALAFFAAAICVVFPSLSYMFGYMFLVQVYCFTLFEAVLAVYLTSKYKYGFLPGAVFLGICGGGYQSGIAVSVSLCFCMLFMIVISGKPLKKCFLYALRFLIMGVLGVIVYFAGMKISLYVTRQELSAYKGMSEIGKIPISSIPALLKRTYAHFFDFFKGEAFFYASGAAKLSYLAFAILGVLCLTYILVQFYKKKEYVRIFIILMLIAAAPIAFNLFDFVVPQANASAMNIYQFAFVFLWLLRWFEDYVSRAAIVQWGVSIACILIIANFYYIDNVYYLKAEVITERSAYLWNRILSRVEETEGYRSDMPFIIASSDSFAEDKRKNNDEFSPVILPGYDQGFAGYIGLGSWSNSNFKPVAISKNLFGFEFSVVDSATRSNILHSSDYLEMNIYPEDGSIKIIDGVMVVNFDAPIAAEITFSPENKHLTLQCVTGKRLADEEFSYVWYIYHDGLKIDTVYTADKVSYYDIDAPGEYNALLFTKDPQDQYSVQRKSDLVTVE